MGKGERRSFLENVQQPNLDTFNGETIRTKNRVSQCLSSSLSIAEANWIRVAKILFIALNPVNERERQRRKWWFLELAEHSRPNERSASI